MKLAEKGRYAPPPELAAPAQRVAQLVGHWPGVNARAHWLLGDESVVDGADFYFGQEEVGHIHLDSEAHIFIGKSGVDLLSSLGLAHRFHWSRDIAAFKILSQRDLAQALWLFELSYERCRGLTAAGILARISKYVPRSQRNALHAG
jgi:hypothetical protein